MSCAAAAVTELIMAVLAAPTNNYGTILGIVYDSETNESYCCAVNTLLSALHSASLLC